METDPQEWTEQHEGEPRRDPAVALLLETLEQVEAKS